VVLAIQVPLSAPASCGPSFPVVPPLLYPEPYPTESNIFLTYAALFLPRKAPLLLTTNL